MRPDRPDRSWVTWEDYIAAMAPVDRACVFNIAAPPPGDPHPFGGPAAGSVAFAQAQQVNDQTAAVVRAYPEKLIGFMSVHPRDPGMLEELERCTGQLGLRGIKLGPNYQNFDPLGDEALRLYDYCPGARACRSCSTRGPRRSARRRAALHPPVGHGRHRPAVSRPACRDGAHGSPVRPGDGVAVIRKHPHVYADVSSITTCGRGG